RHGVADGGAEQDPGRHRVIPEMRIAGDGQQQHVPADRGPDAGDEQRRQPAGPTINSTTSLRWLHTTAGRTSSPTSTTAPTARRTSIRSAAGECLWAFSSRLVRIRKILRESVWRTLRPGSMLVDTRSGARPAAEVAERMSSGMYTSDTSTRDGAPSDWVMA